MDNFGTATKTGVKTSTKVIVGFLALGSIVAGVVLFKNKPKLFAPTIFPPATTTPSNLACNDSDGGIRIDIAGVTSLQDQNGVPVTSNADYCLSKEEVKEYYCGTKYSIASVNSPCPRATTKCLDGRCVSLLPPTTTPPAPSTTPTLTCDDSLDGGANIFVYGVTYLNDQNGVHLATRPDYCIGSGSVRENSCDSTGNLASSTIPCPPSNVCSGGRCFVPTSTPTPTTTSATTTAASLNITNADVVANSRIYGPDSVGVQLGKWSFGARASGLNGSVTLKKLTLQTVNPAGGALLSTLGTFGTLSLYDGVTLLATGNYVQGTVVFSGFVSNIPANSDKVYTLRGNINSSGTMTNNVPTAFVIASDQSSDIEAVDNLGVTLGRQNINYNIDSASGPLESRFARSRPNVFHDAFPIVTAVSVGSALPLDIYAKLFKFSVTNAGTRDLRMAAVKISHNIFGLAQSGSISDFRLYEDNGAGGLGTYIAHNSTVVEVITASPIFIDFNSANDQNSLLENMIVSPGATRTFIVTADTTNMAANLFSGNTIRLSSKIVGLAGWGGASWNTGDLMYYYTPIAGVEEGPFSASDSYGVTGIVGGDLSYTL